MPVRNVEVAAAFSEIADLLEIANANPFRVRAYRTAARTVTETSRDLRDMLAAGEDLTELRGIGADLAGKIREILDTGTCAQLQSLRAEMPPAITELLDIPGLGPRRVQSLYHELGIQTLEQLGAAAAQGRIREVPGFGPTLEKRILDAVSARIAKTRRVPLADAAEVADPLVQWLRQLAGVGEVTIAGSFRRMRDTVGDLDVLVTARREVNVGAWFVTWPQVLEVLAQGPTKVSVRLRAGLQVDVRVVAAKSYGAALHYFTGSKAHNIAIRRMGQERGLKINEYGVFRGDEAIAGTTEASVFAAVGLPFIAPELREDRGEIAAAMAGTLPELVTIGDLRGDLHVHSRASDGLATLEELAAAAALRDLDYLGIADRLDAGNFDLAALRSQLDAIDRIAGKIGRVTLLRGLELAIDIEGNLPQVPKKLLDRLDFLVVAVHDHFDLSRDQQTRRVMRALAQPRVAILAHPTGRLLGERAPCALDLAAVLRHAHARGCHVECNAEAHRLDLNDDGCRAAREAGVGVVVSAGLRTGEDLGRLVWGVGQARRGWLQAQDVLNTRPLAEVQQKLRAANA